MASRIQLGLVTTLTVASLLLGGGAMNALAKDNDNGKGNSGDHGPSLVTGESRPGLGCGDTNHVHTGAPGNPDKECKD